MIDLKTFLWEQFPEKYAEDDSYKDGNGQGLLERFMIVLGEELQTEVMIPLDNRINELNPDTAADKYLSELAYSLGRPIDVLGNVDFYREILTNILKVYRLKGTMPGYKLLFELFGLSVTIIEYYPKANRYDQPGRKYNDKSVDALPYDQTENNVGYIDYSIRYDNLPGRNVAPFSGEIAERFKQMVIYTLQPIDCRLRSFSYYPAGSGGQSGFPYKFPFRLSGPDDPLPVNLPFKL
jgi:phage tail-like protein